MGRQSLLPLMIGNRLYIVTDSVSCTWSIPRMVS